MAQGEALTLLTRKRPAFRRRKGFEMPKCRLTLVVEIETHPPSGECPFLFAKIFSPKLADPWSKMALTNIARGALDSFARGKLSDDAMGELKKITPQGVSIEKSALGIREEMLHLASHGVAELQVIELEEGEICSA